MRGSRNCFVKSPYRHITSRHNTRGSQNVSIKVVEMINAFRNRGVRKLSNS